MSQQSESVLNDVLIDMARSLLQYVAESSPWVDVQEQSVGEQAMVIAARQRQDVADIAALLTEREHVIDFGTFPTDYTDLQFLALDVLFDNLLRSQTALCESIDSATTRFDAGEDPEAAELLKAVGIRQKEAITALKEVHSQLSHPTVSA